MEEVEEVGWQEVVQGLQEELVHYGNSLGLGGSNFLCGAFSQVCSCCRRPLLPLQ